MSDRRVDDEARRTDVHRTLEYARPHRVVLISLPFALLLCAWALYGLNDPWMSSSDRSRHWLMVVIGTVWIIVGLFVLRAPNTPALSVSTEGITYWMISNKPIPWREIQGVETERYWTRSAIVTRTVTSILVSREFYERINGSYFFLSDYVEEGSPVKIRLLHYEVSAPFQELHDAVVARWQAFGPQSREAATDAGRMGSVPRVPPPLRQ